MPLRPVVLLYEDCRYGPIQNFGLHKLVCALVADTCETRSAPLDRRLIQGHPKKGRDKVFRACQEDLSKLSPDGRIVIAVLDRDRIHERVGLKRPSTDAAIRQAFLRLCNSPPALRVALIAENTESVLRAAQQCDGSLNEDWLRRAIDGKELLYRDIILGEISKADRAAPRQAMMKVLPCLRDLRDLVLDGLLED